LANLDKLYISIAITTFNQEDYISEALEGILMQECTYSKQIVVSDDNSTDTTISIIEYYAKKFPHIIKIVSPSINIGMTENFNRVLSYCDGKYIALCDGDDYWTDNNKLQKQIDFLEQNPKYSFCCHGYSFVNSNGQTDSVEFKKMQLEYPDGFDITIGNIFDRWVTQPLTVVFRKNNIELPILKYKKVYDIVLFTELLLTGVARWIPYNGGCYRLHESNYWNTLNHLQKFKKEYETFKEMNVNHPGNKVFTKAVLRSNFYIIKHLWNHHSKNRLTELSKYIISFFLNGVANLSTVIKLILKVN